MPGFNRLQAAIYDPMMRAAERGFLGHLRAELGGRANGTTLEIGAGTGAHVPHYRAPERVVATEPDPAMLRYLRRRVGEAHVPLEIEEARAEQLPFDATRSTPSSPRSCCARCQAPTACSPRCAAC